MRTPTLLTLAVLALAMSTPAALAGDSHPRGAGMREAMLKQADLNGDGSVTVAEAQQAHAQRAQAIDSNNDGNISVAELEAHAAQRRQERRAQRLLKLDSNGDGVVSTAEFVAARNARVAQMDRNGDGILQAEELTHPGRRHRGRHR